MACLSDDEIFACLQETVPAQEIATIEQHVNECADCRMILAEGAKYLYQSEGRTREEGVALQLTDSPTPADRAGTAMALTPLPPASRVGRYVIETITGSGGMGIVYVAHDPGLHRKVALKLLRPTTSVSPKLGDVQERLLREARAMAQL